MIYGRYSYGEWDITMVNGILMGYYQMVNGNVYLVAGFNPSEKNDLVNWDDEFPNGWKNKKQSSKPPTRNSTGANKHVEQQDKIGEHLLTIWG